MTHSTTESDEQHDPEGYVLPDGEAPEQCDYCGAPFSNPDLLALHRGLEHEDVLDEDEREQFETAHEAENEEVRLFRLKALGLLVLLYFGLLMAFSVFG